MKVKYKDREFTSGYLLDEGYDSDRVEILDLNENVVSIGGDRKILQLFVIYSFFNDKDEAEIKELESNLHKVKDILDAWIIVPDEQYKGFFEDREIFKLGIDYKKEFLDFYGVELTDSSEGLQNLKAIFIITKEGTLFYKDTPKNLEDSFNLELFYTRLNNAFNCYSGISREEMGI
jgi:peroxiredoxin